MLAVNFDQAPKIPKRTKAAIHTFVPAVVKRHGTNVTEPRVLSRRMQNRADRLKWARRQAGYKTATAAAEENSWNVATYRAHESGKRSFKYDAAVTYARKFNVNPSWLMTGKGDIKAKPAAPTEIGDLRPIRILGEVAAGRWMEIEARDDFISDIPVPADPRYPIEAQFALIARGTSLNRIVRDGEIVICVDLEKHPMQILDEDPVVVEQARQQEGLYEVTGKRVRKRADSIELMPDSDDPRYNDKKDPRYQAPITVPLKASGVEQQDGRQIRIKALIAGVWKPFSRGRASS